MSVDCTITGWLEELRYSEQTLGPYLESLDGEIAGFTGQFYKIGQGKKAPENYCLEWLALMRSQMLLGDPMVRWTSPKPNALAPSLTIAMNRLSRQLKLRTLNEQLLTDFAFKWCVCLVKNEPAPGVTDNRMTKKWPAFYRISPRRYRYDCLADKQDQRRWQAHLVIGSRKEIRALADDPESGWNAKALDALETQDTKKFFSKTLHAPQRDEIAYWEIWCPGEEHEKSDKLGGRKKGYNGTIYTVVDLQSDTLGWVREPRPAFVPPWGPYVAGGDYVVPDDSTPMGPLTAAAGQADFVNRVKNATIRAIENYKRILVCRDAATAKLIRESSDDFVYSAQIEDIAKAFFAAEIGGATQQHFAAEEIAKVALDTVLGINDLMRGRVDPSHKATQDVLASQASGSRMSGTTSKFYEVVTGYLYTGGYFIHIDDDVEIEMGEEAAGMFTDAKGRPTTTLRGGSISEDDVDEFFNLDLELRVGSMERTLEMDNQLQAAVIDQHAQQVAALGLSTCLFMDWDLIANAKSEIFGMPVLKRMVSTKDMKAVALTMMQQGMQQGGANGAQAQAGSPMAPQVEYAGNPQKALKAAGTMAGKSNGKASGAQGGSKALASRSLTSSAGGSSSGYQ